MPELGHFLGNNTVGIRLAKKRLLFADIIAITAPIAGYTMIFEYQ